MEYEIQIASADNADRYDKRKSKKWETVASGDTAEEALEYFIGAFNDEEVPDSNNWLRLVKNGKIVNF